MHFVFLLCSHLECGLYVFVIIFYILLFLTRLAVLSRSCPRTGAGHPRGNQASYQRHGQHDQPRCRQALVWAERETERERATQGIQRGTVYNL